MSKSGSFFLRVPVKEQILFARNISLMVRSGMPLLDSLYMIEQQTQSRSMHKVLQSVIDDLENGQFLSTGLKKFEGALGSLFINIIRVGESSGTLSENLELLAVELKKRQMLTSKILNAMLYPIIILVTTLGLTSVLMFLIFPKILPVFSTLNVILPLSTRVLIKTHAFFTHYWLAVILSITSFVIAFRLTLNIGSFRFFIHRFFLHIPILGPLFRSVQVAMFARTFAVLLKSGTKIVEALGITSEVMPNLVYRQITRGAADQVRVGAPLGKYLQGYPKLFPKMFSQMVEVSETAGTLETTLNYLSDYYEQEVDETAKNMISLLEPLMMVFMGGLVGFISISIILPIYSLGQTIGK